MEDITIDSDAGLALLWLAVRGVPMHYSELAARMWPDNRNIRVQAEAGRLSASEVGHALARRDEWAAGAAYRLIRAGLAEVDAEKGEGWVRVTVAGMERAWAWGVGS